RRGLSTRALDLAGAERVKKAGLALVEALRVEGIAQVEERVVEVVADLVEERAEERLERDDLPALRGEHPHDDHVAPADVGRRVTARSGRDRSPPRSAADRAGVVGTTPAAGAASRAARIARASERRE